MSAPALYADLSHYYDLLCSSINYHEQCDFALRANRAFGNGGRRYLDLACGSGAHLEHIVAAGFNCAGLDISAEMLALAAQRCPQAQLHLQDMSELNFNAELDFITCFLYSMHYNHPISTFKQTLERIYAALAPGGLFCFDAVDKNSVANDAGHTHHMTFRQQILRFQTRWFYCGRGETLDLHIHIHERQRHYREQHIMTALSIAEIRSFLYDAGFTVNVFERDFERLLPWQGNSGNVLLCACKSNA